MKKAMQDIRQILAYNRKSLLLFELAYLAGSFLLFYPLVTGGMDLIMKLLGYSSLTNRNIVTFLGELPVILFLTGVLLLVDLTTILQACCLFSCFGFSRREIRVRATEILLCGWSRMKKLGKQSGGYLLLRMLFVLPIMHLPFLVLAVWNYQPLLYLGEVLFTAMPRAAIVGIGIVIFFVLSILNQLQLPQLLIEKKSDSAGILHLTLRNLWKVILFVLFWLLSSALLLGVLLVFLMFGGTVYAKLFVNSQIMLAFVLGWKERCVTILFMAALFISMINYFPFLYVLFIELREKQTKEPVAYASAVQDKEQIHPRSIKRARVLLAGILIVEILFIAFAFPIRISALRGDLASIEVTGHRGGDESFPENTEARLQDSIRAMIECAEIDVQETVDGIVVLMHDLNLRRTTGINDYVYNLTYAEILQGQLANYSGSQWEIESVPTLASVLELCDGKIRLNIEIKSNKHYDDTLVEKVVNLINAYSSADQCTITSTNYHYLEQVKELNPNIRTGYIMKVAYGDLTDMDAIDFISIKYSCVTDRLVEAAHADGKEVHVWTVNSRSAINKMKGFGVDNMITDRPYLTKEILAREDDRIGWMELLSLFVK